MSDYSNFKGLVSVTSHFGEAFDKLNKALMDALGSIDETKKDVADTKEFILSLVTTINKLTEAINILTDRLATLENKYSGKTTSGTDDNQGSGALN